MVRTWCLHCRGLGSIPGQGTKILQAARRAQKKNFFSFFFQQFDYDVSKYWSPWVYPIWRSSWICRLMFVTKFGEFMSSNILSASSSYFFLYGTPVMGVSVHLMVFHRSPRLCSFFFILFTFCSSDWIWTYLNRDLNLIILTNLFPNSLISFFYQFKSTVEPL